MSYSIIGSGAIGSELAGHFASKGIEVLLTNRRGPTRDKWTLKRENPKGEHA